MIVALVLNAVGYVLLVAGVMVNLTVTQVNLTAADGWRSASQIPTVLSLIVMFPLLLKFKNDVGEFPKSHMVLCILSLGLQFLAFAISFGIYLSATLVDGNQELNGGAWQIDFILIIVGYLLLAAGLVLEFIQVIRLRKKYQHGGYAKLSEESAIVENYTKAHPDANPPPKYASDNAYYPPPSSVQAPPSYQGPPSYQQPAAIPPAYQSSPNAVYNQPAPSGGGMGEFDYDKERPSNEHNVLA
jgi:hypothetical protein